MTDDLISREAAIAICEEYSTRHGTGMFDTHSAACADLIRALPSVDPEQPTLADAARGLTEIVEGIDGAMNHGTWRNDNGKRLKDTQEWVQFYVALRAIADGAA